MRDSQRGTIVDPAVSIPLTPLEAEGQKPTAAEVLYEAEKFQRSLLVRLRLNRRVPLVTVRLAARVLRRIEYARREVSS